MLERDAVGMQRQGTMSNSMPAPPANICARARAKEQDFLRARAVRALADLAGGCGAA